MQFWYVQPITNIHVPGGKSRGLNTSRSSQVCYLLNCIELKHADLKFYLSLLYICVKIMVFGSFWLLMYLVDFFYSGTEFTKVGLRAFSGVFLLDCYEVRIWYPRRIKVRRFERWILNVRVAVIIHLLLYEILGETHSFEMF